MKTALLIVIMIAVAQAQPMREGLTVGGNTKENVSLKEVTRNVLAVSQFKGHESKSALKKILSSAKVTQAYTQVVAGVNKTYVLKTSRGYECFKIYINL